MTSSFLYTNPGYNGLAGQRAMSQQPAPHGFGDNVVASPDAVYVNGDNVGTPQQSADQPRQFSLMRLQEPFQAGELGIPRRLCSLDVFETRCNSCGFVPS